METTTPSATKLTCNFTSDVALEINEAASTLGTPRHPLTVTETDRRALLQQARSWRVSADLSTLSHGTFNNLPATLLVLSFHFAYQPRSSNRLTSAEINISFQPEEDDSQDFPCVQLFQPKAVRSNVTDATVRVESSRGASISTNLGPAPVSAGVSAERTKEVTYAQQFGCDVVGQPWTSDEAYEQGCEVDNAVTWHVNENKLLKEGVPMEVRVLLMVTRPEGTAAVRAKVKAKVKTNWGLSLFGTPWSGARPLVISEGVVFGGQPSVSEFAALPEEELTAFIRA